MAISKEIRWFFNDNIKPMEEWFANLPIPQKLDETGFYPRQDYYLAMPGVRNLGIKIREPKKDATSGKLKTALEVKQQISDNEPIEMRNAKAFVNTWQKFSYELVEGAENLLAINLPIPTTDKNWIRIDKDRIMVKYDADNKKICEGKEKLDEACGIELTKIQLLGKEYYSLGLEAFSTSGKKLEANFKACCDYVFKSIYIEGLTLENSLSYPEFLADANQ
ncbi:MAG: hypothetical protein ABIN01_25260 [Ferruginibacter sp.]